MKEWSKRLVACMIVSVFLVSTLSIIFSSTASPDRAAVTATSYPNDNDAVLWVRRNGSDPGFPYGGANVSPGYGMSYFGTQTIQVTNSYSLSDANDPALFPLGTHIIYQIWGLAGAQAVAAAALTNPRIVGAFWDDFPVGLQSHANMSAIYAALHANDITLGRSLKLGLVVYNYDYFKNSPNTWASITNDFDIIHFWFYPNAYDQLYACFAGYESALLDFHAALPTKEVWLGVYLHYYNAGTGSYPLDLTYRQLGVAGRMIYGGIATRISILENFWIQHNTATAALIRDYLNSEITPLHKTTISAATGAISSTTNGIVVSPLAHGLTAYGTNNWTLVSDIIQNITVTGMTGTHVRAWDLRTGSIKDCHIGTWGASFYAEPGEKYRLLNMPLANTAYTSPTTISTPTAINCKLVYLNSTLLVNSSMWINNSLVVINPTAPYVDYMKNHSLQTHGITLGTSAGAKLYLKNSAVTAKLGEFPYVFNTQWTASASRVLSVVNSTIACYGSRLDAVGYTYVTDSTIYAGQPNGGTYYGGLWLMGNANELNIRRSLIWANPDSGSVGFYCEVEGIGITFDDNTVVGGQYGVWIANSWGPINFNRCLVFSQVVTTSSVPAYTRFKAEGTTAGNRVLVTSPFTLISSSAISGELRSVNGTIGTYSTDLNGTISAAIPDSKLIAAGIVSMNPYPWHFDITTAPSVDWHYFGVWETALYNNGTVNLALTRYLTPNGDVAIANGMQRDLHAAEITPSGQGGLGLPTSLHPYITLLLVMFGLVIAMPVVGFALKAREHGMTKDEMIGMVVYVVIGFVLMGVLVVLLGQG